MLRGIKLPAMAGALVLGLGIGGAFAQETPQEPVAAPEITDEQLDQFIIAVIEVRQIQVDATAEAQAAGSEEEGQTILEEANQEAAAAVEDTGLSVEEYNMILAQVQSDPDLLATVQERINDEAPAAE